MIAAATLRGSWENPRHSDFEQPPRAWYEEATKADWRRPAEVNAQYASVLKRRVVAISYKLQIAYVKFVGTHKEYDAIDAETVEPV